MVKLRYTKSPGVSSQMGLVRFSEETAKGLKMNHKVFMLASLILVVLLYAVHVFLKL